MSGAKHQATICLAHFLAPACGNATVGFRPVRDADPAKFAELGEIIPRNGGPHDALGLEAL